MEAAAYRDADNASAIYNILVMQDPSDEKDQQVRRMMLELCESLDLRAAQVSDLLGQFRFLEDKRKTDELRANEDKKRKKTEQKKPEQKPRADILEALLDRVGRADVASMFAEPVSAEIEGYSKYIKNPMDLATIRRRLASYQSITAVEQDLATIIDNCVKFNGERTPVGQYALETAREWREAVQAAKNAV
jgi:hypothetical protein